MGITLTLKSINKLKTDLYMMDDAFTEGKVKYD